MFDFVNSTYSGVLSILSTLLALTYPLIIGCIEKIDNKFNSTKLSERFITESSYKWFKCSMIVNLIMAVFLPFIMDNNPYARIMIGIQCVGSVILVVSVLRLFYKILNYYNIAKLQNFIIKDYYKAVQRGDKNDETKYFNQWIEVTNELLKSADIEIVQSVYVVLEDYIVRMYKKYGEEAIVYDSYFYEGVSRINEFLCKGDLRPISVNNSNSILSNLIYLDSAVSDTTYRYLWRNLRIQIFYSKDEWIIEYWKVASQKISLFMRQKSMYDLDKNGNKYTAEQIESDNKLRDEFMEFHIMLCAMLLQQKKYELLELILSYTNTEPPSYPLIPSKLSSVIDVFNNINNKNFTNPFYFESRYQMPNMHGITEGKIVGAANMFLALLVYRLYVIHWAYGQNYVLNSINLPDNLLELEVLKNNLNLLNRWLEYIKDKREFLDIINMRCLKDVIAEKIKIYNEAILEPKDLINNIQESINTRMDNLKVVAPLSEKKISEEKTKLTSNIVSAMEAYNDFLEKRNSNNESYNLDSSVTMPFPNAAFLDNSDSGYFGMADTMSSYMLDVFQHKFASSFYREHKLVEYTISSEDIFRALDKMQISSEHIVITFGVYLDYFIDKIKNLKKESDNKFCYNGTKILNLDCSSRHFSQRIYIMRDVDCPFLEFKKPSDEEQMNLLLKEQDNKYALWLSIEKISDHPELLKEPNKISLGDNANLYSLFTAIWIPMLYFKSDKYPLISIKIKYPLIDEGVCDSIDSVKPFPNVGK